MQPFGCMSRRSIATGLIVVFGLIAGKRFNAWTALFLVTTIATSVTGFGFPIKGVTLGIVLGVISLQSSIRSPISLPDSQSRMSPSLAVAKSVLPSGENATLRRRSA